MNKTISIALIILSIHLINAQDYRVGKVSKEELSEKVYAKDSTANAVKLYVNKRVYFKYYQGEGFKLFTEVHERIKIYNKEGYDWATKEIKYYTSENSNSEKLNIKEAKTYVLEDGKIVSYKLKNNEVYTENLNKYWTVEKFTMPNIVDGCVVEWSYTIISPYQSIDRVVIQSSIPTKKYEASIEIPEYYNFNIKETGYSKINLTTSNRNDYILLTHKIESNDYTNGRSTFKNEKVNLVKKIFTIDNENIPALIEEPYVNEITNYASTLHFELASVKWPQSPVKIYSQTWEDVTKTIYKNAEFGLELEKSGYFKDDLATLISNAGGDKTQLMVAIFEFVKNKVKWNKLRGIYTDNGVKDAYKKGVGNVADINFILIAMLKEAGISANPILISTRDNGIPNFPTINGFNYVIAGVEIENEIVLMDATETYSAPNILPLRVINWQGRIVRESGSSTWVDLTSKALSETYTSLDVSLKPNGEIEGIKRTQYSNNSALSFRNKYGDSSEEKIIEKIEESENIEILDFRLSNYSNIYKPIIELSKFKKSNSFDIIGDKMYIKPLFFLATTKNPFKLENREYPIDFGTPFSNKEVVTIEIPEGYTIESIPESISIGLPNNFGYYQFKIDVIENRINVLSVLKIETPIYPAEDYKSLKEFFKILVNKNIEQIILKKQSL